MSGVACSLVASNTASTGRADARGTWTELFVTFAFIAKFDGVNGVTRFLVELLVSKPAVVVEPNKLTECIIIQSDDNGAVTLPRVIVLHKKATPARLNNTGCNLIR